LNWYLKSISLKSHHKKEFRSYSSASFRRRFAATVAKQEGFDPIYALTQFLKANGLKKSGDCREKEVTCQLLTLQKVVNYPTQNASLSGKLISKCESETE